MPGYILVLNVSIVFSEKIHADPENSIFEKITDHDLGWVVKEVKSLNEVRDGVFEVEYVKENSIDKYVVAENKEEAKKKVIKDIKGEGYDNMSLKSIIEVNQKV